MDACRQDSPGLYQQRDGVLVRCLLYAGETAEGASVD
jgi:hypothetical protein